MEKIPDIIDVSWHEYLQPLFDDERMKFIKYSLLNNCKFYPSSANIFRVFSMPLKDIKVVILGQDPYPNGEAIGLAFAVNKGTKLPFSLKVIKNEIEMEFNHWLDKPDWCELNHWVEQGVFLLNTALTVEEKKAGSHIKHWKWFTTEVIKIISRQVTPIWMLWGLPANSYISTIRESETFLVNTIITAPHPAAEAYGNSNTFSGKGVFGQCNKELIDYGKKEIQW